jgi:hypothetical protein
MAGPAAGHEASLAGRYQPGNLAGVPEQAGETRAGLPRRMPRASAHPGSGAQDFGLSDSLVSARLPALSASADGTAAHQEAGYQEQAPTRRRSPEAARSRLSGFQLGSRDAVQAGARPGQASPAGEENGR